jgi:5-enolpyruvylshikimate-3-phosphate synthase
MLNILDENIHAIEEDTETMLEANREFGLEVNIKKTKHMVTTRHQNARKCHKELIGNKSLEHVTNFKYL